MRLLRSLKKWIQELPLRWEIARIIRHLQPEDRERLRKMEPERISAFHFGFGMGLRNGFRHGEYPFLYSYCYQNLGDEPLSFDALSSIAIRKIWEILQTKKDDWAVKRSY